LGDKLVASGGQLREAPPLGQPFGGVLGVDADLVGQDIGGTGEGGQPEY
jgi:hypothetical protein